MSWAFLQPKRRDWFVASGAVAAAAWLGYVVASWWWPWAPGQWGGLTFGTLASVLFLVDALYPLRRRLLARPLGTAQHWVQLHIYGGLLACLFVFLHIGFRQPGGQFGWWLLGLTVWSTASGLVGVWLQKWIPILISRNLSVEALYERIPELVARLQEEADRVAEGSSEILARAYSAEIRPQLATVTPSWSFLADIRGGRERRLAPFQHVQQFLDQGERQRFEDLQAILTEKTELDAHYSLQRVLRVWLVIHVPPAMLLLALAAVHIAAVLGH
jgi:hypothetical protein